MKRKSPFIYSDTILKIHAFTFVLFIVGLWWSMMNTITYSSSAVAPLPKGLILDRIGLTLFWGFVFLAHFTAHHLRAWWHKRKHRDHLRAMGQMQTRYIPQNHLEDVEADGVLVDEIDWVAQQRLQTK